jgi:hypothetical protein
MDEERHEDREELRDGVTIDSVSDNVGAPTALREAENNVDRDRKAV